MAPTDKLKQSLYFPDDMLREIMRESNRLDRSLSWTVQQAWRVARADIQKFPGVGFRAPSAQAPTRAASSAPAAEAASREPSDQVREFLRGKFERDVA